MEWEFGYFKTIFERVGGGGNVNGKFRKEKKVMLDHLSRVDLKAEGVGLCAEEWLDRYQVERDLENLYDMEEKHWEQRGNVNWITHRDANTSYFHSCANGRRKNFIFNLEDEGGV